MSICNGRKPVITAGSGNWQVSGDRRGDFTESKEQIRDTSEEVKTTPNELEVFMEVRETMLLDEHEASENPHGDPAGTGVGLQGVEAATSTQIRLKHTLEICKTLNKVVVDAAEQTEPTFYPDDVSQLVMSMEGSNLNFPKICYCI